MDNQAIDIENLYNNLLQIDREFALETRMKGCPHCGCVLHSANYPRVPKGLSGLFDISQVVRFSFCCSSDECRRRVTPASVRFLGPKQYLGVLVVLLCAKRHLNHKPISEALRARTSPYEKTVCRWMAWWQDVVPGTRFWAQAKGRIMPPLDTGAFCDDLVALFSVTHLPVGLSRLLCFISPLSVREFQRPANGK